MKLLWAFVLQGTILAANGERHKLTYIYTGLSKPINLPGIHEFTAMTMLDDRIIDYYDSVDQRKIPKVDWMKENLSADYWEKGTQSRQSKQQWFKDNIESLMERMRQNDTDLHVLQGMHGCEGETQPDGSLKFVSGMDKYNYDGDDSLSFDITLGFLVAPTVAVEPTKIQDLKENPIGYLEKECIYWLSKFLEYVKEQLKQAEPPTVHLFAKKSHIETNTVLTCLATGFIPKETEMKIKQGNRVLTRADGVQSTGPLPNRDGTFQRRDYIEVPKDDRAKFTCEVSHTVSGFSVTSTWDMTELPSDEGSGNPIGAVGGAVGGLILLSCCGFVYFLRKRREKSASPVSPIYRPVDTEKLDVTPLLRNRSTSVSSGGTTKPVNRPVDTGELDVTPLLRNRSTSVSSGGTTKPGGSRGINDSGVAFNRPVDTGELDVTPLLRNRSTSVSSGGTTKPVYRPVDTEKLDVTPLLRNRSTSVSSGGTTKPVYRSVDTEKLDVTPLLRNRSTSVSSGGTTKPGGSRGIKDSGVASAAEPEEAKSLLTNAPEANPDKAKVPSPDA